jgi:glycosyltransferase involved in cell wall biosynthesis
MKLAYATEYDPYDVDKFSGTGYHMMQSLRDQGMDVMAVGPLTQTKSLFPPDVAPLNEELARKLRDIDFDVVFSSGLDQICTLDSSRPIVFWHDSTNIGLIDYYPYLRNFPADKTAVARRIDQRALSNCRLAIFSSEWAAGVALDNYDVDSSKVKVVPFGANLDSSRNATDIERFIEARPRDRCRLLFVGRQWRRKGGDIALQVARELNRQGLDTQLIVLGCAPDVNGPLPDFVQTIGYISKSSSDGAAIIDRLYSTSNFMIVPTRAECFGIVFAEASSFGLPSLATRTGGITTVIKDDKNGKLFPLDASIAQYCDHIIELMSDRPRYEQLCRLSFLEFESRLNWSVNAGIVKRLLEQHCR